MQDYDKWFELAQVQWEIAMKSLDYAIECAVECRARLTKVKRYSNKVRKAFGVPHGTNTK